MVELNRRLAAAMSHPQMQNDHHHLQREFLPALASVASPVSGYYVLLDDLLQPGHHPARGYCSLLGAAGLL